ncbi:MAG: Crp/Fnr family transcriptional regulator [Chromatiales bacterium]|nr:Crp/Fnr family transcriptional regulator [Chromatiales bacterium]
MFPQPQPSREERRLLRLWRALNSTDQAALLRFAEFLSLDSPERAEPLAEPDRVPRPAEESVIAAIRRLSASYPMIDKDRLLHQTSGLMTQHVLQGRAAAEVIDELEQLFENHYSQLRSGDAD